MSFETKSSQIEQWPRLQDSPEYQKQLDERVKKVEQNQKYAVTLTKANDVLEVLNLPESQDDILRKTLIKLDNKTLEDLAKKEPWEIMTYIFEIRNDERDEIVEQETNTQKDEKENQKNIDSETLVTEQKLDENISSIKSIFTSEIIAKNQDIAQNLEWLNLADSAEQKGLILEGILNLLKEPWRLATIIESIWWANPQSKQYQEFKTALVSIDQDYFKPYFEKLELKYNQQTLNTKEIINNIEKSSQGVLDIDLKSNPPVSKMSLEWSDFAFTDEIDLQALAEMRNDIKHQLESFASASSTLNDFNKSFNTILSNVWKIWHSENFRADLKEIMSHFSKEIFSELDKVYRDLDIPSEMQIDEFDFDDLSNINSKESLQPKVQNITDKIKQSQKVYVKREVGGINCQSPNQIHHNILIRRNNIAHSGFNITMPYKFTHNLHIYTLSTKIT